MNRKIVCRGFKLVGKKMLILPLLITGILHAQTATVIPIETANDALMLSTDANKKYKIKELNIYPGTKTALDESRIFSGDFLITVGYNPDITSRRTSVVLEISKVD